MRRPLITSDPSQLTTHDHVAWSGEGPEDLDRLAEATFAGAIDRGERLLFVADDPDPARLSGLVDLEALLDRGALQLASVGETYHAPLDMAAQQAEFGRALDDALAEGYSGICVVADNSEMAAGSDRDFTAWLEWEATADRMQATHPISGVCYFDSRQVSEERLADIAVLHPVLSEVFARPSYRLFADDDVTRLVGELDSFCAEQLWRLLQSAPLLTDRDVDMAEVDFIDHRALMTLNCLAAAKNRAPLRLCGAKPFIHRLWALLEVREPALELC